MQTSPLLPLAAPVETISLAGWTTAAHYGDIPAEIDAVHRHVGLIDQTIRGRLAVGGPDRGRWLNKIVSNETAALQPGEGCRALLLSTKGRITCDLRVYALADSLLLETAFDTADGLLEVLRGYVLFGDQVTVTDRRQELCQLGVHGPAAAALLRRLTGLEVSSLSRYGVAAKDSLMVARTDDFGPAGYDLFAPLERAAELWEGLRAEARPFGWRAAEVLRLEAGRPRWGAELTPDYLPLEAELSEALSHTKGCYPGQEVVARMRDRGHANRLLRRLAVDGTVLPQRGATLTVAGSPKPVGLVTSVAR
ncbi:MAG: folate-binding protein YgfZ, partial [Flavobacteriales bacterium]|nr:folate-binding protein YgfZ [Flavobacteriales bacterium]